LYVILLNFNRHKETVDIDQLSKDLPELVEILTEKSKEENSKTEKIECNNNNEEHLEDVDKEKTKKPENIIRLVPLQLCALRIENLIKVKQQNILTHFVKR